MKQLAWTLFITLNIIMAGLYLWGADNNRYICAWLWGIFPLVNITLYGIFEKDIIGETL